MADGGDPVTEERKRTPNTVKEYLRQDPIVCSLERTMCIGQTGSCRFAARSAATPRDITLSRVRTVSADRSEARQARTMQELDRMDPSTCWE